MVQKKAAKKVAKKPGTGGGADRKGSSLLSAEERAAMRETLLERRGGKTEGEEVVLAKIRGMKGADRTMGEKVHAIVKANAPDLAPKLWYGMPAYAKDGKIVCFFQDAAKFKARYATFGFSDKAALDDGGMWPSSFALKEIGPAEEAKIGALLRKAVR